MLKKNKKEEIKEKEIDLKNYKREIQIINNFVKLIKSSGQYTMVGVHSNGTPQMKLLSTEDLIKMYKLEALLKLLKENI